MFFVGSIFILIGSHFPLQSLSPIRLVVSDKFDFNNTAFSDVGGKSDKTGSRKGSEKSVLRFGVKGVKLWGELGIPNSEER
ncbi:hypothetical protein KHM19_28130 [Leptospira borgpetersenii]|nr:hypothetical protein KHM09_27700 [Leptospira borgpetersenii]GIM23630.1 hypothetical protein KHM19_28130 [Leptospira borgpetersenii]GIM26931.1 hypothetical protein KHM25_28560 [Leptospira borgpetersenii]